VPYGPGISYVALGADRLERKRGGLSNKMKASRYNILIPLQSGQTLLFNSSTVALAEIDAADIATVSEVLADPEAERNQRQEEIFQILCEGKFLVPAEIDELSALTVRNRRQRFGGKTLFLTIAPTLGCNFGCPYCFENRNQGSHLDATAERALLEFARKRSIDMEQMLVTWFGGEPTLCLDQIERLQSGFLHLAHERNLTMMTSSMVTNGYLLDRAVAKRISDLGIKDVQVTLDGPQKIHDKRRRLLDGGHTFERIVANIEASCDLLQITIRMNVDRSNADHALTLARYLHERGILAHANLYFAPVGDSGGSCSDLKGICLAPAAFSKLQVELYRTLMREGINHMEYPMLAPGGHCGADSDNSFVVSPAGDLFKCWEEISMDRSHAIGSIFFDELSPRQQANQDRYLAWDPLALATCQRCSVLPLCMGGCPHQSVYKTSLKHGACCSWKYNLADMLAVRHNSERRKEVT
jgi:uncharacterized protein